jgi:ubiquinone/menaquinone biosynthesis C-methylase UbiE
VTKARIVETVEGIQDEFAVDVYDRMMRRLRDKGWMETDRILKSGITRGSALEIGPGPGYLGLEWLKKTEGTSLTAVEISKAMIHTAEKNAREYGLSERVRYVPGDAHRLPFDEGLFDAVFSNGSLHEWADPAGVFTEIHRVLKTGGKYFVSDLRRNMNMFLKIFLKMNTKPVEIRQGLISSINAAYLPGEIESILKSSTLDAFTVRKTFIGLEVTGEKKKN